jgi:hypothetical protein
MALPIPKKYIPEMNKIRNLPDSAVGELVRALESSSIVSDPEELAANIAAHVPSIPKGDLNGIVDFIYGLYHVREFSELSKSNFLTELIEGVLEHLKPKEAESGILKLREKFRRLLSIDNLDTISKAINLQRGGERLYCVATILSDIRPVFGHDVKSKPAAAVITHTLKIAYHETGDHKEFFVVLDDVDLSKLEEVIKRAKLKSKTLKQLLEESDLPQLGI